MIEIAFYLQLNYYLLKEKLITLNMYLFFVQGCYNELLKLNKSSPHRARSGNQRLQGNKIAKKNLCQLII